MKEPEINLAMRRAKLKLAKKYCAEKGWTIYIEKLSAKQIMEIRD